MDEDDDDEVELTMETVSCEQLERRRCTVTTMISTMNVVLCVCV